MADELRNSIIDDFNIPSEAGKNCLRLLIHMVI